MIRVRGGCPLMGEVQLSGSKNAALPIIAANAITGNAMDVQNIPNIADIHVMQTLIDYINLHRDNDVCDLTHDDVKTIRSSILLIPYGLIHWGVVHFTIPGGCKLGKRPLTTFDTALMHAGVDITYNDTYKKYSVSGKPRKNIILEQLSVTATEALITYLSFSSHYDYPVTIYMCAIEPHIADLIMFLRSAGARIEKGYDHSITVFPYNTYNSDPTYAQGSHTIINDYIEAGFYAVAGAIVPGSDIIVRGVPCIQLHAMFVVFDKIGVDYDICDDTSFRVTAKNVTSYSGTDLQTMIYPGLPTDQQPALVVLLTQCHGISKIHEPLFEGRFAYLTELEQMGARIEILNPHQALVVGPTNLAGDVVTSKDLRGGGAILLAGLVASGMTTIVKENIIYRGYECIVEKLAGIGADIEVIHENDNTIS